MRRIECLDQRREADSYFDASCIRDVDDVASPAEPPKISRHRGDIGGLAVMVAAISAQADWLRHREVCED